MQILENDHIKLRALEPEDLNFLFETENDYNFWEVSSTQKPFSKYILKQYLENAHQDIYEAKQLRMVIVEKGSNENIGFIDLFDFNPQHRRAGIGILVLEKFQNKGYAFQAIELFLKYAFELIQLKQVFANIPVDNHKSISLFSKLNFTQSGIKKNWIFSEGKFKDVAFYQLINQTHES